MRQQVLDYLNQHSINFSEYRHPAVFTVAESKSLNLKIPAKHCKNLFIKSQENFFLVSMEAEKKLNLKKLQEILKVKKLSFGTSDELKKMLNIAPGSVSIFCMINAKDVKLILDKNLWESDFVGFHPNDNTSTLVLDHKNLEKFYKTLNSKKEIIDLE